MSLRDDLLEDIDEIRGIPASDDFGLHLYTVTLRITTWAPAANDDTDIQLGRGSSSFVDRLITLANGLPPKVRRVRYHETVAAGGKYQAGDFRVGPLTPDYLGGGITFEMMAPMGTKDARTHYHFILKGPDQPAAGQLCSPVAEEADRAFHRTLLLHPEGQVPSE